MEIRKAVEEDRDSIAYIMADSFIKDWEHLSKDLKVITNAIKNGLYLPHYYVAVEKGELVAFLAEATSEKRAFRIPIKDFKKQFGFFKGAMFGNAIRQDFEKKLLLTVEQGYIDILGVLSKEQGKGIASMLVNYYTSLDKYKEVRLTVADNNDKAYSLYKKMGFEELEKEPVKFAKQRGFSAFIHMKK